MLIIFVYALITVCVNGLTLTQSDVESQWIAFKKQFRDTDYQSIGLGDESIRRQIFEINYRDIVNHNTEADQGLHSFKLGVNQFTDWTTEEYQGWLNKFDHGASATKSNVRPVSSNNSLVKLPDSVDWRQKGAVTPIKDQGSCGSCWAFAAVGGIEGQIAIKQGKLLSLSEQELLDCTYSGTGCNGGSPTEAYNTLAQRLHGIQNEQTYPYRGVAGTCRADVSRSVAKIQRAHTIFGGNEALLQQTIANVGPVAICFDASLASFKQYSSGVYSVTGCDTYNSNHCVTVVGYGTESGHDYWLLKNSWNTRWGEAGYMKLARNHHNMCGVASWGVYPEV